MYFLFGRFIACINTCQGELCKIGKPPSLSIKTLKNVTPENDEKCIFFSDLKYLQQL